MEALLHLQVNRRGARGHVNSSLTSSENVALCLYVCFQVIKKKNITNILERKHKQTKEKIFCQTRFEKNDVDLIYTTQWRNLHKRKQLPLAFL